MPRASVRNAVVLAVLLLSGWATSACERDATAPDGRPAPMSGGAHPDVTSATSSARPDGTGLPAASAVLPPEVAARRAELTRLWAADPGLMQLELGMLFDAHELPELAAEAYLQAGRLLPGDARAPYHLGRQRLQLGDLPGAIAAWEQAVARAPTAVPPRVRLGEALAEVGRLDEARACFERAIAADPGHPAGPESLARLQLQSGELAAAESQLQAYLAVHPERGHARYLLGTVWREQGRLAEAEEQLRLAAGSSPAWEDPWVEEVQTRRTGYRQVLDRAVAAGQAGAGAELLPELRALQAQHPDDVVALEKFVAACLDAGTAGQRAEARSALAAFETRVPGHARAAYLLALLEEAEGHLPAARSAVARALAAQPGWVPAHELGARLCWKSGDLAGAAQQLEQALHAGGELLDDLLKLGRARTLLGELPAAAEAYRRATLAHPESVDAWTGRAETELAAGDRAAAAASLERGLVLSAADPRLLQLAQRLRDEPHDG